MYANSAIPRILLKRLYHVAPTDDSDEHDEHCEGQSEVEALYPKPLPVFRYCLNEIASGAPAEHLVLCGHAPRVSGHTNCSADLLERSGNGIFEVAEELRCQNRGIRFLCAHEEQAPCNDHDEDYEADESDPFVQQRRALVKRDRGENKERRENDAEGRVDGVHSA